MRDHGYGQSRATRPAFWLEALVTALVAVAFLALGFWARAAGNQILELASFAMLVPLTPLVLLDIVILVAVPIVRGKESSG